MLTCMDLKYCWLNKHTRGRKPAGALLNELAPFSRTPSFVNIFVVLRSVLNIFVSQSTEKTSSAGYVFLFSFKKVTG